MPDLCTLQNVKDAMETATTASDALISSYIARASAEIERRYQRQFGSYGASTKPFPANAGGLGSVLVDLAPYDLNGIPSAVVLRSPDQVTSSTLTSLLDYVGLPTGGWQGMGTFTQIRLNRNIIVSGYAIQYGYAELVVTASWGATTTPVDVVDACVKTVCSWLDRAMEDYALQNYSQSGGPDQRPSKFGGFSIPAQAHRILWPYSRDYESMVG